MQQLYGYSGVCEGVWASYQACWPAGERLTINRSSLLCYLQSSRRWSDLRGLWGRMDFRDLTSSPAEWRGATYKLLYSVRRRSSSQRNWRSRLRVNSRTSQHHSVGESTSYMGGRSRRSTLKICLHMAHSRITWPGLTLPSDERLPIHRWINIYYDSSYYQRFIIKT